MTLRPDHVGQRVVVRRVVRGELGPSGGPALTDVLGILEVWSADTLSVRHESGELYVIAHADVTTAKPVPPRASVRHRITPEQLQRICNAGWRAPQEEQLGDWVLRSGGGFTGRANSALVAGDPGLPVVEALAQVRRFYASAGKPALAQVIVGSPWLPALEELGWTRARPDEADALVQVASVAQARRAAGVDAAEPVEITGDLTEDWQRLYHRAEGLDDAVVRQVLTSGDSVGFARIGSPARAIGRGVVTGDWVGIAAVSVEPASRRRGLAHSIVDALLEWAASQGATSAYLQTLPDNTGAMELYAGYGFTTHHTYRYLLAPG